MTTPNNPEDQRLSLRVMIDRKRKKVVFAEADSDFVDVLFSFMTMPLGTIVRLLDKHDRPEEEDAMGRLKTLRDSLQKLSSEYFWTEEAKLMLLHPRNLSEAECRKLKLNLDDSQPTKYFICKARNCLTNRSVVSVSIYNVARCQCGKLLDEEIGFVDTSTAQAGIFATGISSFLITDDLRVKTNLAGSTIELLNSLGIKDMTALEERTCSLGLKEMVCLLKGSIISKTPLSDVVLHDKPQKSVIVPWTPSQASKNTDASSCKMVLKVFFHKSSKKVIFAQAEEDFIDFLFSLLAIPLGAVVSLLSGNTNLVGIDNLHKSISCLNTRRYLKSEDVRTTLLNPMVPLHYICGSKILNLRHKSPYDELVFRSYFESQKQVSYLSQRPTYFSPYSSDTNNLRLGTSLMNPKGGIMEFVREPALFMVTDDLEITPLTPISGISYLNKMGIPFCDVEELVLNIGTEEAKDILKASISSSSALTNGLIHLVSKIQPKQEK